MINKDEQLELIGGPLDGDIHYLEEGYPIPDQIGIRQNDSIHWYLVNKEKHKATYNKSDKQPAIDPRDDPPSKIENINYP